MGWLEMVPVTGSKLLCFSQIVTKRYGNCLNVSDKFFHVKYVTDIIKYVLGIIFFVDISIFRWNCCIANEFAFCIYSYMDVKLVCAREAMCCRYDPSEECFKKIDTYLCDACILGCFTALPVVEQ